MDMELRKSVEEEIASTGKSDAEKIEWLKGYLFAMADQRDAWATLYDHTAEGKALHERAMKMIAEVDPNEPTYTSEEVRARLEARALR